MNQVLQVFKTSLTYFFQVFMIENYDIIDEERDHNVMISQIISGTSKAPMINQ